MRYKSCLISNGSYPCTSGTKPALSTHKTTRHKNPFPTNAASWIYPNPAYYLIPTPSNKKGAGVPGATFLRRPR